MPDSELATHTYDRRHTSRGAAAAPSQAKQCFQAIAKFSGSQKWEKNFFVFIR